MAKQKTKKKHKKTSSGNRAPVKKRITKVSAKKRPAVKKKVAKKKSASKKAQGRAKTVRKKTAATPKNRIPAKGSLAGEPFRIQGLGSRSAGQSGDLQGLSNRAGADSESVDELLEEGNAFEADVVAGVESAGGDGEPKEVRTHEVPEDDVPGEYLDNED